MIVTGFVLGVVVGMFWIVVLGKSAQYGDEILHESHRHRTRELDAQLHDLERRNAQRHSRRWE